MTAGGINQGKHADISVDRVCFAAGWFVTPNIHAKGGYVIQTYHGYPSGDIAQGGKYNGLVLQRSIGF